MKVRRLSATVASTALVVSGLTVAFAAPAQALQGTVPAITSSTWQTNSTVRALAAVNGMLYVAGDFTSVRPPGAAAGTGEVARTRIARFNASTGALDTTWVHTANATVRDLVASPDGTVMYMSGDFTSVDGQVRNRVAAFSTATGALTTFAPNANASVYGIAVSDTRVYLGGNFTRLAGVDTARVGAVTTGGAGVPGFVVNADRIVYDLALSKSFDKLYVAGGFVSFNGDAQVHGAAAVNADNGTTSPLPAAQQAIPEYTPSCITELKAVTTDANNVYFGSEGTGGGCFDGTFAAKVSDGSFIWKNNCLGATQGIAILNGFLYTGSHAHDCQSNEFDPDAFPEVGWARGLARHLLALDATNGTTGPFYPNTNGGPNNSGLGPRVLATDGTQLFVGGEFTTVNGAAQQGFTRFAPLANGASALPARPATPRAVALPGGGISIAAQASLDNDDTDLTVRLYRDGGADPVATQDVHALFWRNPVVTFVDSGLAPNSLHTYTVDVVEKNGTQPQASQKSPTSAQVRSVATVGQYQAAVNSDSPTFFWRLGEPAGPVAADSSAGAQGGQYWRPFTFGVTGPVAGDPTAVTTNGIDSVVSSNKFSSPSTFSAEAWFRTTTTSGGKIIGFGNKQNGYDFSGNPGISGNYDKHVYMTNDGRVVFGVYNGSTDTVTSPTALNDGQWHHVVATQGSKGMALYVDGAAVGKNGVTTNQAYDGYWRVGGDNIGGWPDQPSSNFFAGTIANVAVYPSALSLTSVRAHYTASGRTPPVIPTPADAYGQAVYADEPVQYLRLDEAAGTALGDASNNGATGQTVGDVSRGTAGALPVGAGSSFANGGYATSNTATPAPSVFSVEAWFNTSSTSGGKIIGFGSSQFGDSGGYDKHIYMTDDGRVIFGVYNGSFDIVTSGPNLNNGAWHHVVGTQGPDGMKLYVDDNLVGSNGVTTNQFYGGYWRLGGDNLGAWPDRPSSDYFTGSIDDAAVYSTVLSPARIDAHYLASGRVPNDTTAPSVDLTAPADGATLNAGNVTLSANATDNAAVAQVQFLVDGSPVGAPDTTAPYSVTWAATAGPHTISAVATDSSNITGSSATRNVTVVVPDTTNPTVSISNPADGSTFGAGAITVDATADDNVGVAGVEFFVDGVSIGSDSTLPYSASWATPTAGSHDLTAKATDTSGNVTTSGIVTVTVNLPDLTNPTVSITAPANNAVLTTGTATTISATADDNVGVASVEFFVDGVSQVLDTTSPFGTSWNAVAGNHVITATAKDAAGNSGTATAVNVSVVTPDTENPTAPSGLAATNVTQTSLTLSWNASSDNVGVTGYQVTRDGGAPTSVAGNSLNVSGLTAGTSYAFVVRARDAAGNLSDPSGTLNVTTTAASSSLFTDSWAFADNSPWAAAWTASNVNGTVDTQASAGRLQFADVAGAYARAQLTGLAARADSDTTLSYRWSSGAAIAYASVFVRGSGGWQNGYRPRSGYGVQITSNSRTVVVQRNVNGVLSTIATLGTAQTVGTGKQWVRISVVGSTVRVKTWLDGTAQPAAWSATVTDTTVTAAGQLFVSINRGGANVGVKAFSIDDLDITSG